MSTPLFLLYALPFGLASLALLWAIARLAEPLLGTEATARRLQRRLDARLARGSDRYFEELRAIEAAIERNAQPPRPTLLQDWRSIYRTPTGWFAIPLLLFLGALLLSLTAEPLGLGAPPRWADRLGLITLILIGLPYLVDPSRNPLMGSTRATRLWGLFMVAVGGFILIDALFFAPQFVTE